MPHRELHFAVSTVGPSLSVIPGPTLVGVEQVELSLNLARSERSKVALEVSINVVRMVFVFNERPVREHVRNTNFLELPAEHFQVRH